MNGRARLKRLLWVVLAVAVALVLVPGVWLLATEAGLRYVVARVDAMDGVRLSAAQWRGRLIGPVRAEDLVIDTPAARVSAAEASLDWQPLGLLRARLVIDPFEARDVSVELKDRPAVEPAPDGGPPLLPIAAVALKGRVQVLSVIDPAGEVLLAPSDVTLDAVLHHDLSLRVKHAALDHPQGRLAVSGRLGLNDDDAVELETTWRVQLPDMAPLEGEGTVGGVFASPTLDQHLRSPWQAGLQGTLAWREVLQWQARLRLEQGALADLNPDWRRLRLAGELEGRGTGGELQLDGALDLTDPEAGNWHAEVSVSHGEAGWLLPRLVLAHRDGPARVEGSGALTFGEQARAELSLAWLELGWPLQNPTTRSRAGTLTVRGTPDAYTLTGEAGLEQVGQPPGRLTLSGRGDTRRLTLERLRADWLGGVLQGTGRVEWAEALRFEAGLSLADLNPATLAPAWPGRMDGELALAGEWSEAMREVRVDLRSLGGELRGHALGGRARLTWSPGELRLGELALTSGEARLIASGSLADTWELRFGLRARELNQLLPRLHGALEADGSVHGSPSAPRLVLKAQGRGLQWQDRQVAELRAALDLDLGGARPSTLDLSARAVDAEGFHADGLTLSGAGTSADHRLTLALSLAPGRLTLEADGRYGAGVWEGRLRDGRWQGETGPWELESPTPLRVAADGARLGEACWRQDPARLCLGGAAGGQGVEAQARVEGVPVGVFNPLLPRDDLSVSGTLSGRLDFAWRDGLRRLRSDLRAVDGGLRLELPDDEVFTTNYRRMVLEAQGDGEGLRVSAALDLESGDFARAEARVPDWRPGMPLDGALSLEGRARASLGQLVWVSLFVPEVIIPDGRLEADLALHGTLAQPVAAGSAALEGSTIAIPLLGIELADLRLFARGDAAGRMQLDLAARSGPGRVEITGSAGRDAQGWEADLRVRGEDFQVVRLPVAEALANPDLAIRVGDEIIRVTGRVVIPKARVAIEDVSAPVQASSDVVVVDGREEVEVARRRWQVVTEVEVVFGDAVHIAGYGLEGRLGGAITVVEPLRGVTTARGEVNVLDGKYEAYGQSLTIAQGRLIYTNAPLGNPGIDFRAVRQEEDVTVGIMATGRLRSPDVRLYSEPPMDDSQILAWLVLGRPIDDATREEADLLQRAAVSLGLAGGTRIAEDIAGEFGVDVVQVEASTQRQEAALVLGKYLSPRLYVQYAVGLFQAQDSLRVRYRLSEHWTLEAQSGTRASADILYTIEK
ncbi:MAG: translocation/assembly module TamB domain-containing protein [Thiohalomonadaceae bacterium]